MIHEAGHMLLLSHLLAELHKSSGGILMQVGTLEVLEEVPEKGLKVHPKFHVIEGIAFKERGDIRRFLSEEIGEELREDHVVWTSYEAGDDDEGRSYIGIAEVYDDSNSDTNSEQDSTVVRPSDRTSGAGSGIGGTESTENGIGSGIEGRGNRLEPEPETVS